MIGDSAPNATDRERQLLRHVRRLQQGHAELQIRIEWYVHRIRELEGAVSAQRPVDAAMTGGSNGQNQGADGSPKQSRQTSLLERQLNMLQLELDRKEGVIHEVRLAAEERLRIVETLPALQEQLQGKQTEIERLTRAANERLELINELQERLRQVAQGGSGPEEP